MPGTGATSSSASGLPKTIWASRARPATAYAKDVVMADFDLPGDEDMLGKVRADLEKAGKSLSDHLLHKHLAEFMRIAHEQVMKE